MLALANAGGTTHPMPTSDIDRGHERTWLCGRNGCPTLTLVGQITRQRNAAQTRAVDDGEAFQPEGAISFCKVRPPIAVRVAGGRQG